jgi:hypothetical protein
MSNAEFCALLRRVHQHCDRLLTECDRRSEHRAVRTAALVPDDVQ